MDSGDSSYITAVTPVDLCNALRDLAQVPGVIEVMTLALRTEDGNR